jgi:hypothetical protein
MLSVNWNLMRSELWQRTDDRSQRTEGKELLNSDFGMRNTESFDFGFGISACDELSRVDCGLRELHMMAITFIDHCKKRD